MSIHTLEVLCHSLLWIVLGVHLIAHTYMLFQTLLHPPQNTTEMFPDTCLMPVDTDTLPSSRGKTTHIL